MTSEFIESGWIFRKCHSSYLCSMSQPTILSRSNFVSSSEAQDSAFSEILATSSLTWPEFSKDLISLAWAGISDLEGAWFELEMAHSEAQVSRSTYAVSIRPSNSVWKMATFSFHAKTYSNNSQSQNSKISFVLKSSWLRNAYLGRDQGLRFGLSLCRWLAFELGWSLLGLLLLWRQDGLFSHWGVLHYRIFRRLWHGIFEVFSLRRLDFFLSVLTWSLLSRRLLHEVSQERVLGHFRRWLASCLGIAALRHIGFGGFTDFGLSTDCRLLTLRQGWRAHCCLSFPW